MDIAVGYCLRMPTIDDIRHANLLKLIVELGGQRALAESIGKAPAQISQWVTKAPNQRGTARAISSASARAIEKALGLPPAWMDQPHTSDASAAPATGLMVREPDLVEQLLTLASPRTQKVIQRIAKAAESGVLSEADVSLLGEIADRLIKPKS